MASFLPSRSNQVNWARRPLAPSRQARTPLSETEKNSVAEKCSHPLGDGERLAGELELPGVEGLRHQGALADEEQVAQAAVERRSVLGVGIASRRRRSLESARASTAPR